MAQDILVSENVVPNLFGTFVFTEDIMRMKMPKLHFERFWECMKKKIPIDHDTSDVYAMSVKAWAIEKGATHWTHTFFPFTGVTATKQDAFIKPVGDHSQRLVMNFT